MNVYRLHTDIGAPGETPSEFRLFAPGWNDTEKGSFLFDADAAASVMAAYQKWGVDCAIDLEHQMLDPHPPADPTARDARGWCRLELRPDGSLWAVDVKWTADGAARLSEKRQRYVSPAFEIDPQTKRVTKIINVAITALPATHNTPALVAASVGGVMDAALVGKALDALEAGDAKAALEILKGLIAAAASGGADPDAATEDAPPPAGDGGADEVTESAAPPAQPSADPAEEQKKKEAVAATARLVRLSGKDDLTEALDEVEAWRASHIELETGRQKLAAERAALESAERRKLCIELVTLGAEFPATVWADDKASTLKPRWTSMSIETLREHVADQRSARGGKRAASPAAPAAQGDGSREVTTPFGKVTLSVREIQACEKAGAKLEVYAANKIRRSAAG